MNVLIEALPLLNFWLFSQLSPMVQASFLINWSVIYYADKHSVTETQRDMLECIMGCALTWMKGCVCGVDWDSCMARCKHISSYEYHCQNSIHFSCLGKIKRVSMHCELLAESRALSHEVTVWRTPSMTYMHSLWQTKNRIINWQLKDLEQTVIDETWQTSWQCHQSCQSQPFSFWCTKSDFSFFSNVKIYLPRWLIICTHIWWFILILRMFLDLGHFINSLAT